MARALGPFKKVNLELASEANLAEAQPNYLFKKFSMGEKEKLALDRFGVNLGGKFKFVFSEFKFV